MGVPMCTRIYSCMQSEFFGLHLAADIANSNSLICPSVHLSCHPSAFTSHFPSHAALHLPSQQTGIHLPANPDHECLPNSTHVSGSSPAPQIKTVWPSGLRRQTQVLVERSAWVRTPQLSFFIVSGVWARGGIPQRSYADLNRDRWIQSPEC